MLCEIKSLQHWTLELIFSIKNFNSCLTKSEFDFSCFYFHFNKGIFWKLIYLRRCSSKTFREKLFQIAIVTLEKYMAVIKLCLSLFPSLQIFFQDWTKSFITSLQNIPKWPKFFENLLEKGYFVLSLENSLWTRKLSQIPFRQFFPP